MFAASPSFTTRLDSAERSNENSSFEVIFHWIKPPKRRLGQCYKLCRKCTDSKLTHLMTSLVPGLRKRQLHFFANFGGIKKIILRVGPKLNFENYVSVQHRLQFSGINKRTKISFHRHFKLCHNLSALWPNVWQLRNQSYFLLSHLSYPLSI